MTARAWGALTALAVILGVSAGWWALALWPLDPSAPEWLARTREICFGAPRNGLPHGGGWVLLVGEPVGMLAALLIGWGQALREGLAGLGRSWPGRLAMAALLLATTAGATAAAGRVAALRDSSFDPNGGTDPVAVVAAGRMDRKAPMLGLVDQHGQVVETGDLAGQTVLVAFAYAHCATVCPVIVRDMLEVRRSLGKDAPPLLIVTLDPWRDTPSRLASIAEEWHLDGGSRVLSGEVDRVELVLSAWQVPRSRNTVTGELIHPALAYVVSPEGKITHLVDGSLEATLLALEEIRAR